MVAPNFGNEALLDEIADSPRLATLVGRGSRYLWPTEYDLRRIPIVRPSPVFPLSALWSDGNPHPGLPALLHHLRSHSRRPAPDDDVWLPRWAEGLRRS